MVAWCVWFFIVRCSRFGFCCQNANEMCCRKNGMEWLIARFVSIQQKIWKEEEIIEENQSIVNRWRKNLQFVVPLLRIYYHKPNLIEQTKFGWDRTWINKRQSNRSKSAHTNNCAGDVVEKLKNFHQFIAWLHISILPPSTKN